MDGRSTMNISLPEPLKAWVDEQVARGGFGTVSEYIRTLIRDAQKQQERDDIEMKLLAGLQGGTSAQMRRTDWDDIRREGQARLQAQRAKVRPKAKGSSRHKAND